MAYLENERFCVIMESLGFKDRPHAFATEILKLERSDKIQNIASHRNRISTDILVLVTTKVVNKIGQKVNGNWLLTGEGPMFLEENITAATKNTEAAANTSVEELLRSNAALIRTNLVQAETIKELLARHGVKEGKQK